MGSSTAYYSAYGLTIRSAFTLPELPTVEREGATVDVVVSSDDLEPVPESVDEGSGRRIRAGTDACRLTYDSIGTFLVEDGERVLCDPASADAANSKAFRRILENETMAVLLLQRGMLVLHASAVSVDGKAAVFLGPRTAGKSTTAAAFHAEGYPVLADDVVGIQFESETPTVVPGVPQLRLLPDAADALGIEGGTLSAGDWGPQKRYRQVEALPESASLAGCYVLREGETLAFEELSGPDRFLQLVTCTYAQGLLPDTETTSEHFRQCETVIEGTPFRGLRRPDAHEELPSLVELVVDDIRSSAPVET